MDCMRKRSGFAAEETDMDGEPVLAVPAALPLHGGLLPVRPAGGARVRRGASAAFDAHLHYNWEPAPFLPFGRYAELLRPRGLVGIPANSRPLMTARVRWSMRSRRISGRAVHPPYMVRSDIGSWFDDPAIFELVEARVCLRRLAGIGESSISTVGGGRYRLGQPKCDFSVRHSLYPARSRR